MDEEEYIWILTLQHRQELEPHIDQVIILQEKQGDALVWQNIIEIRHKRPVAVFLHDSLGAVDDVVKVLAGVVQGVLDEDLAHHQS